MAIFDQRGQHVTYQYNAAGNINFGAVQNKVDMVGELRKLQQELNQAIAQKALEGDAAIDAEYLVKKAVAQAEKPRPDKATLLEHLTKAKDLVAGVSGLAGAFAQAVEKVGAIF